MGAIVLTGLTPDWALPNNYVQVNFAAGPSSGADISYPALLIGNKTSAGSATADTVIYGPRSQVPLLTETDAIALFGTGSELHLMWLEFTKVNKSTAVSAIAVAESAGVNASATITWTSAATAAGVTTVWVDDEFVQASFASGDSVTTIATAVKNAINAKTKWPVTATNSSGVLTITCRNKGPRGNWHRFSATIDAGVGTSVDSGTPAYFTGGTTADDNTAALATISPSRFYWNASAADDATQFKALCDQLTTNGLPLTGIRERAFAGYNGTQANCITITTAVNNARAEMIHLEKGDVPPFRMAARLAAIAALYEVKPRPRHNFDGFGNQASENSIWTVPAPRSGTVPSPTYLNTSLNSGITPVGVNPGTGTTYIVKRCTTRFLNGSNADYRIRDPHKVSVCDFFADDWKAKLDTQFAGKDLADDPKQGQHVPGPDVATPNGIRGALFGLIDEYAENDQLQNVDAIKAGVVVQRSTTNTNRAETRTPLQPISILDSTANAIDQIA